MLVIAFMGPVSCVYPMHASLPINAGPSSGFNPYAGAMNNESRQTTLLRITGMSCAGCVDRVERALAEVPGANVVAVSFAAQTASVSGPVMLEQLTDAVARAGYSASQLEDESIVLQTRRARQQFVTSCWQSLLALLLAAVLMVDMMFGFLPDLGNQPVWLGIALISFVAMWITGGHFFRGALSALRYGSATMDTLIALGTGTAWCYSLLVIVWPELVPPASRHQFLEAALFVIGFVNLGKALELNARTSASLAIARLFDLTPSQVALINSDGSEVSVPIDQVNPGDSLRVRPGENVPVDGTVTEGRVEVNEALLTGESVPVLKMPGDTVNAGTTNLQGTMIMEATHVGAATRLAAITTLVREAQNSKPAIARLVDQITKVFVPVIMGIALLTATLWMLFGPEPRLSFALVTTMSVLIIACPCALGLAVPMSVMVGLGRAAQSGLLIRNSEVLQIAASLDIIVMDKTGTLTFGEPVVTEVVRLSDTDLAAALTLATGSSHPLSVAIADACRDKGAQTAQLSEFNSLVGEGLEGRVSGQQVLLGSLLMLQSRGVTNLPDDELSGTIVAVAIDGCYQGHFGLTDAMRPEAAAVVSDLQANGVQVVMLTGDRQGPAESIAGQCGISQIHTNASPEDKLTFVRDLQRAGHKVGVVGDGINDAAALGIADVGFAMGLGADVAMQSADITLRGNQLTAIPRAISLSRAVVANVRQNLLAAFAYNIVLIPVAAGVLYPGFAILIDPSLAGFAMAMSSVSVVLNAGRLRFS